MTVASRERDSPGSLPRAVRGPFTWLQGPTARSPVGRGRSPVWEPPRPVAPAGRARGAPAPFFGPSEAHKCGGGAAWSRLESREARSCWARGEGSQDPGSESWAWWGIGEGNYLQGSTKTIHGFPTHRLVIFVSKTFGFCIFFNYTVILDYVFFIELWGEAGDSRASFYCKNVTINFLKIRSLLPGYCLRRGTRVGFSLSHSSVCPERVSISCSSLRDL